MEPESIDEGGDEELGGDVFESRCLWGRYDWPARVRPELSGGAVNLDDGLRRKGTIDAKLLFAN